ncbi:hypothetical protein FQN52_002429 [Onygenales sp. PD_12]|nr:hypothetical protein FQN52_002429 [Onygenales sp. PD_12]
MGRTEPPFLYDPPAHNRFSGIANDFDPRAVTRASWTPREPAMEKTGPLVNFNRHPDSVRYSISEYAVIPDGKINKKTMSPRTKSRVKFTRIFQLLLRILTLIGALGMLFCVICIKNTTGAVSWMIRVAPGVSILQTVYGIYHLSRSSAARTPASSASYMLFAAILDAGLIPLYVFTGMMAQAEHTKGTYGWDTLFETKIAADKIIYATFLGCYATAGLHLASLIISLYLAVIFRKISKLPPDMNPLEDNLTSRAHKRTKSEITAIADKHLSDSSFASSNINRGSIAQDPLITPTRSVPFMHTRADSTDNLEESTRSSYYSAQSHRFSRSDLPSQQLRQYEQAQQPKAAIARTPARGRGTTSRPQSVIINTPPTSRPGSAVMSNRDPSGVSGVSSLTKDNWFVYPSSPSPPLHEDGIRSEVSPLPSRLGSPEMGDGNIGEKDWENTSDSYGLGPRGGTVIRRHETYSPLSYCDDDESKYSRENTENLYEFEEDLGEQNKHYLGTYDRADINPTVFNPLEMNPPTPQPAQQQQRLNTTGSVRRIALTDLPNPSVNSQTSTPVKPRPYSTLEPNYGRSSPFDTADDINNLSNNTPTSASKNKKRWTLKTGKPSVYESLRVDDDSDDEKFSTPPAPRDSDRKGRVVSNSGIDLGLGLKSGSPGYGNYIAGLGVGRRRDVSGKVAEEGRGGIDEADSPTKPKGRRLSKTGGEIKAAGWARWKGL